MKLIRIHERCKRKVEKYKKKKQRTQGQMETERRVMERKNYGGGE